MVSMNGDINYISNFVSYVLADIIIFVYGVSFIFWHYINVDEVSWITLKTLLHSAMELLQIAMDGYYKLRQLFFITKWETVYYKIRQVLQSAMKLLQIATGITKCDDFYKLRQYTRSDWLVSHQPFAHWCTPTKRQRGKVQSNWENLLSCKVKMQR